MAELMTGNSAQVESESPAAALAWDQLRCPDCHGVLQRRGSSADPLREQGLACVACAASYRVDQGIPLLIGQRSQLNQSEVETQDRVSDEYDGVRYQRSSSVRYHEDTMRQLVELAPPRGSVLDDGCGTGAFLEFARRSKTHVERYVGIDVSRGMLGHAARRLALSGQDQILVQADACRLPFADDTFDVVYARALLHHLPDPADGLREIRRVLKPGGTAVVLDPNKTFLSELPRYVARQTKHFDADHKNFRVEELQRLVGAELTIAETRFFGYVAYPLLGFPDLINFDALGVGRLTDLLIRLDRMLARVPSLRRFGWGVIIAATKSAH
jgi:ubiquinone/menaquinone biosynthesis C-methylase UbiE